ncbi:MAG: hypothetical protein QOF58_8696, partial [Pseudonocardiales bacterium]|nr:hypothetical protein [Pseudonocardiales bacterium]
DSLDNETLWRLALLASVSEKHGHDWASIANRLRRAVDLAGIQVTEHSNDLVHRALDAPPDSGHSIVWLAIDHAWVWGPSPNPAVTLINGDWLLDVLRNWNGPRDGVPRELAEEPELLLRVAPRFDEDADPKDQLPVTFARIDLGEGPTAGARDRARDTLDLLCARASAQQGGTNWRISGVCLHFVDDKSIFESSGPIGDPDIYTRLTRQDILQDPTGSSIHDESVRMRAHLPVRDGRLHAALQLSRWLTEARISSPPARLVLSGRILEQAANWAAVSVPDLIDQLTLPWAWDRILADLSRAGAAAVLRMPGADGTSSTPGDRQTFIDVNRELLGERLVRGRPRARPWRVLPRLSWLVEQHPADSEIGDYLRELHGRLADGPAAAAWIDELMAELTTRNARAVRTRNVIVHGGPLVAAVAATVVSAQDDLGSQALEWVIEGLAAERELPGVFAERRARYSGALQALRTGGDPQVHLPAGAAV